MNILLLSDVYFPRVNGVSTSIQTLREALLAAGHEVTLVVPRYGDEADEPGIVRVAGRRLAFDPEDRLMYWRKLMQTLHALPGRHDVVHIHTPFFAHYAGLRYAKRMGLPVMETYHTLFEEYFYLYLPVLPRIWLKRLARAISSRQCNQLDAVVAPSEPMLKALRAYGVHQPVEIIPTGMPRAIFAEASGAGFRGRHGIAPERPMLLFVGRVAHEKNIGFLLRMMAGLRQNQPEACLIIAGEGPAEPALRREAEALGLGDSVRFVGYLNRGGELLDCYRAANLFVFASRTETQGLVLLEAMAQGTPVVALAEMGTKDVLKEGEGCRIAPDDPEAFARLVAELLAMPDELRALSARAVEYAHGWRADRMAARMVEMYGRLAAGEQVATALSANAACAGDSA